MSLAIADAFWAQLHIFSTMRDRAYKNLRFCKPSLTKAEAVRALISQMQAEAEHRHRPTRSGRQHYLVSSCPLLNDHDRALSQRWSKYERERCQLFNSAPNINVQR